MRARVAGRFSDEMVSRWRMGGFGPRLSGMLVVLAVAVLGLVPALALARGGHRNPRLARQPHYVVRGFHRFGQGARVPKRVGRAVSSGADVRAARSRTPVGPEVQALRTPMSQTFSTGGGRYVTKLFAAPVYFWAAGGRLQPIDDRLVASTGGYAVRNAANGYLVQLPVSLSARPVRIQRGGYFLTYGLAGAGGAQGRVTGATGVPPVSWTPDG